jgi:hypothetical protein
MAKDKKDIELPASTADDVKGGVRPPEPGASSRGTAGPARKHAKRLKKSVPRPSGGMPHE